MSKQPTTDPSRCAVYLKALGDPLRLKIVRALQAGPLSVTDLSLSLEHEIGTISHHLRVLYHADLVTTERDGKYIYYSLSTALLSGRGRSSTRALDFGCCKLELGVAR